jgi:hypothetical protein
VLLEAPGAADAFACLRLTRLNSSVSARTRFMCCLRCQYTLVKTIADDHVLYQKPTSVQPSGGRHS